MDIFISSVGKGLKVERQAVIGQVLKLGDRPVGMEYFGASPETPLEECLSQLAETDLMILVLGPSYGSVHPGTGLSYTENEFRYAQKSGIRVLVFAAERLSDQITVANDADAATKYQEFLSLVKANAHYEPFGNPDQLAAAVSTGIHNYKRKHGELGRRVCAFATAQEYFAWSLEDPKKYFNHSWALVGRGDVIDRINDFARGRGKVGVLYGAVGLGKSRILLEFANGFDEEAAGWKIRFLREAMPLSGEFARALPADPCIVVIDDAQRYTQLETALTLLREQPYAKRTKFILTARPSAKHLIDTILTHSADTTEIVDLGTIRRLSEQDARRLAEQALGRPINLIHLDRLVKASSHTPIVIVVGGALIRDKQLDPGLFATDEAFQRAVLDRFYEEVTKILPPPTQPWRDLLTIVSALGPVRAADSQFQQSAAEFLEFQPWDLVERLGVLEQAGLLWRRGGLLEVTPDVLADHLLQSRCVSPVDEDTGFGKSLFDKFAALSGANLFRNLGELQWRIDQTKDRPKILSAIWAAVETEFAHQDYAGRVRMLGVIREAAIYQPEHVLRVAKQAIELD